MIAVNIVCVGKLKEAYWKDAIAEYTKRMGAYAKLRIVELSESKLSDNPSEKEISQALESEGKTMLPYADTKGSYNIAMCIEGTQLSSEGLAQKISGASVSGASTINLFIGSSFGLCDDIKKRANLKLSISKMTLPHQLARVVTLEQVYRAFAINAGTKYHK